jgi:hypothetical protein
MPPDDALPMLSQTEVVSMSLYYKKYRKLCCQRNSKSLTPNLSNLIFSSMKKYSHQLQGQIKILNQLNYSQPNMELR